MSVKKLFLTAAGIAASVGVTAAVAGGPDQMAAPVKAVNNFYVEGSLGYVMQPWDTAVQSPAGGMNTATSGSEGGVSYGADFGYMFDQNLGVEMGAAYLPRFSNQTGSKGSLSLRDTWASWLALKAVAPITSKVDAFFKAGVSYRHADLNFKDTSGSVRSKMREYRPVVAVGGTYNVDENWMTSLQYMHIAGGKTYRMAGDVSKYVVAPAANLVSFSVGYKFAV